MFPSLCIDFGAAYTKIAYRPDPNQSTQLLSHESLSMDPGHVCIPSVAAWRESDDRWVFGINAADLKAGNGIRVFRDWKRFLFEPSEEFRVTTDLDDPELGTSVIEMSEDSPHALARKITLNFFKWLRKEFVPNMLGEKPHPETILRVAIPEFSMDTLQAADFDKLVTEAGWFSPGIISISEPLSNMIGTLSQGRNKVMKERGRLRPDVTKIFGDSELLKFVDDELDENREGDSHTILVIDVGNFTTDFGIINIDLEERGYYPFTESESVALGVNKLDRWVLKLLPEAAQKTYHEMTVLELERMRNVVFSQGQSWQLPGDGGTIGAGAQGEEIQKTIHFMGDKIAERVKEFLELLGIRDVGEAILTGGGNNIPALANRLSAHLDRLGITAIHAPELTRTTERVRKVTLSQEVVRGASALGGASVLFDA